MLPALRLKDLVELIAKLTGFEGEIIWDRSKLDGQPRRMLDTTKAEEEFGFKAKISLEDYRRENLFVNGTKI